jgi:hypothetical protein
MKGIGLQNGVSQDKQQVRMSCVGPAIDFSPHVGVVTFLVI